MIPTHTLLARALAQLIIVANIIGPVAAAGAGSTPPKPVVVTLQTAARTSSVEGADVTVLRQTNAGGAVQAVILNGKPASQRANVHFTELTAPTYDVYVDGSLIGSQSPELLEAGLPVDLKGTVLLEESPVVQRVADGADVLIKEIRDSSHPDVPLLTAKLANVLMWSRNNNNRIRNSGGTHILLNPTGVAIAAPTIWTPIKPDVAKTANKKYWEAITYERSTIYKSIKDDGLRNRSLAAITPVDLTAARENCEASTKLTCRITNKCESALSGKLVLETPKGSKPVAGARFSLDRGKSFDATFDVSALPPAVKDGPLTVRAEIKIGPVGFIQRATMSAK